MSVTHIKHLALTLTLFFLGVIPVNADTLTVINTNDSGPGSLRQATLDAQAGDTIQFGLSDPGPWTITLTSGQLVIDKNLTITGPLSARLTISGNNADRIFQINGGVTAGIQNVTVTQGNVSTSGSNGGGICNFGTLNLDNCTITNCTLSGDAYASYGGGLYSSGTLTVNNCTIANNSTSYDGVGGGIIISGQATITNTLIYNNTCGYTGGGFVADGGTATLTNCTIASNGAQNAGALYSTGTVTINNCTIANNYDTAVGLRPIWNSYQATFNSKNSIIANSGCINFGAFNTRGVNYSNDNTCPGFTQVTTAQLKLGSLADNGGPTQTIALLLGSIAIDATTDGTDWDGNPITTDQRGSVRPAGTSYDVGAYELFPNRPPVADAGPDQTVTVPHDGDPAPSPASVTLDGSASSDPDGDTLTYQWKDQDGNVVGTTATVNVSLAQGTYTYTLVVTDTSQAASAPDSVTITVGPEPNKPPIADAGQDQTILTRDYVTHVQLHGSGSSDPDGDTLEYFWAEPGGSIISYDADPTVIVVRGDNVYTLYLYDPYTGPVIDTVTITVTPNNQNPIAQNDSATTVKNNEVTIPVLSNDSDPDGDSLNITNVTQPAHGMVVDNHDGTMTYTPATDYTGSDSFTYTLEDNYGGTAIGTVSITVVSADTRVYVQNDQGGQFSGTVGQTITLKGILRRVTDNAGLPNRPMRFRVDGSDVGFTTTIASGSARVNFTIPDTLGAGSHTLTVDFTGDGIYNPSTGTGTLTVSTAASRVYVQNDQGGQFSGTVGQTVTLKGILRRVSDNAGLSGRTLTFKVDGNEVGSASTIASGSARYNFTIPESLGSGTHSITVEFAGDTGYSVSTGTGSLTVAAAASRVYVQNDQGGQFSGTVGQTVTLKGILRRVSDNAGLSGRTLTFKVDGNEVGSASTISSGSARYNFTIPASLGTGSHTVTVEFAGDANYNSSSGTGTLQVN